MAAQWNVLVPPAPLLCFGVRAHSAGEGRVEGEEKEEGEGKDEGKGKEEGGGEK